MINKNKKLLAIKDKPYTNEPPRSSTQAATSRMSPIIPIINSSLINSRATILPFYRAVLIGHIDKLYEMNYLLFRINSNYQNSPSTLEKPLTIEDEAYEDDISTVSTSTTPPTLRASPNTDDALSSSEQIIDNIYSDIDQLTSQFNDTYNSLTNPIEKLITIGDLLCNINDCYVTNANSGITDLETALEYVCDAYYSYLPLYKQLLTELLARAQNTEDFHTFNAVVNKISDSLFAQNEDIINSFEYGPQTLLLLVHTTFNTLPTCSESKGTTDYQNQLYNAYELDPSDINYACFLLVRSNLLNRYLQGQKSFDNRCKDHLIKDFVFIAKAMQHIHHMTLNNSDLQSKLELYSFWNNFASLAINLLKSYGFQESALHRILYLNTESIQSLLGLLKLLDPKYFLEIKPVKRELIFSCDPAGVAMHNNYYNRPGKTKISLQYIDLETIADMISDFESYLKYATPFYIPPQILFKIKLLQRRYISESFRKFCDINKLLSHYLNCAQIVEKTTEGIQLPSEISGYYFQLTELLAHRYYEITGKSIPSLDALEYGTITNPPTLSYPSW